MAIAVNRNRVHPYVLVADRTLPVEQQTVWNRRTLRAVEAAEMQQILGKYGSMLRDDQGKWPDATVVDSRPPALVDKALDMLTSHAAEFVRDCKKVVAASISSAENLLDENGQPVVFVAANGRLSDELIDLIADDDLQELALACLSANRVTERDLGNSSSLPAS